MKAPQKLLLPLNESTTKTTTTTGKYGSGNNDNMGRHVINESTTKTTITKGGAGYGAGAGSSSGNMSRKVIVESTTTTTKGGYGGKQGSGYSFEKVSLNKSGNEKEWGSSGTSITFKGASKGLSGSGSGYTKELKTTKVTGGKRPWELEVSNGDEVFTGRHPSDEEASTGGNGYSKYSSKREAKFQPSKQGSVSTSKATKFSVKRTGNVITKGY